MGCPGEVQIGDSLVFSICTHDADTGALTDAAGAPTYRVYEDETAVPILTGTMAVLDTVNTTGFYTEKIDCTVANGFENGKTYTVYIEATVDGITGGITYAFKAYALLVPAGTGAITWTYTLTDADTGAPIDGAEVWVTTDGAGTNVIASGVTNTSGVVTFTLDAGAVYVWRKKAGYNFTNPDAETVA
jgi:hypothetical protein